MSEIPEKIYAIRDADGEPDWSTFEMEADDRVRLELFGGWEAPYFRRDVVRQVMVDTAAGSVPQATIDLCRAEGVDPHDALQMGWAAACFKLKALMDALDEEAP